jgi:predicted SnoaL-like aldol condensation-catalyzing enzyme/truncated hemoglobin YjbI
MFLKLILLAAATGLVTIHANSQTANATSMTNKGKAIAINQAVQAGDATAAAALVKETYIQHTPGISDGRQGLVGLVTKIKNKEIPALKITNVRIFEDGEFVVLHHDVHWPGRKAMFEIFKFDEGLATEHWSGIMDHPATTANGHSMLDGPTEVLDKTNTQKNKEFVKEFVETVFIKGQFEKLSYYYHTDIIQHNPFIDNTIPGLLNGIEALQRKGITIEIEKIVKVLGEGNFVLVCSEGKFAGKPTAFFDLFRTERGKIMEHWDVLQELPPDDKMVHQNGFFKASLYKRLGGYDAIAGFVDLAFPRVAVHPQLQKYFTGHAMDSKYRQRQLIVDKLSSTLQGPTIYLGRSLESVHKGLNITSEEWDTFMVIITQAMDERGIKGEEKMDFVDIFQNIFRAVTVESEIK